MTERHRVLLAIAYPASEGPVIAALDNALPPGSEIRVVYVEDRNLLRLAELTCAREIGGASAQAATSRRIDLTRTLQRHAAEMEISIAEALADRTAALHFEIVGGTVAAVALERAHEADITVLVQAAPRRHEPRTRHWAPHHRPIPMHPLLVLTSNGTPADLRATAFAERLGRTSGRPLRAIQLPLSAKEPSPGSGMVAPDDAVGLARSVRYLRPWAVVASAAAGPEPIRILARMADAFEAGIFLVR